jgi:hypothetical protein
LRRLASGPPADVALSARGAPGGGEPILVFDDASGRVVDLDLSGSEDDIRARYAAQEGPEEARAPGRPKLGVVAREVTLLPRQWDWLAAQPGGASAALRRLVDAARKHGEAAESERSARERTYRFLHAIGGDLPGFEEVSRALFAGDRVRFAAGVAAWAPDVAAQALRFAEGAFAAHDRDAKTSL